MTERAQPLAAEHHYQVDITTFGYIAVAYANEATSRKLRDEQDDSLAVPTHKLIDEVREHISELDENSAQRFEVYMQENAPAFLQRKKAETAEEDPWKAWLTESTEDSDVLDFLQMMHMKLEALQHSSEFTEKIELFKENYKARTIKYVADGVLPKSVLGRLDQVDTVEVVLADIFNTTIERESGYHYQGENSISISAEVVKRASDTYTEHVFTHEMDHRIVQVEYERIHKWPDWLTEAITESLQVAPNAYKSERALLDAMLQEDDFRGASHHLAYYAYASSEEEPVHEFERRLDELWGEHMTGSRHDLGAFDYISGYVSCIEQWLEQNSATPDSRLDRKVALDHVTRALQEDPSKVFGKKSVPQKFFDNKDA